MSDKPKPDLPAENDKPDSINAQGVGGVFNLESLLLAAAVLLLGGGLLFMEPGLGFWVLLLSGPALFRAFALGALRRSKGETPSLFAKIMLFFSSAALTAIVGMAALIAFVAICFPIGLASFTVAEQSNSGVSPTIFFGGLMLGIGAGIAILIVSYRLLFWRRW